jgi:hypothetical protein
MYFVYSALPSVMTFANRFVIHSISVGIQGLLLGALFNARRVLSPAGL